MTINKSSWHYNMNFYFSDSGKMPKSLCGYFWKSVSNILLVTLIFGVFLFLAFILLGGGFFIHSKGLAGVSVLLWSVLIVMGIGVLISYITKNIREKKEYKEPKKYIVIEYWKAVKNRICPLITYK